MTNKSFTLYIGITNNLIKRIFEHKHKLVHSFSSRYNINRLIYFEEYNHVKDALLREKQIKSWTRKKKLELIKKFNPNFQEIIL